MKNKLYIKLIFMLIVPLFLYYFTFIKGLDWQISTYIAITSWAIYIWTTSLLSTTMVAIFLPVAYLLSDIADAKVVFSPWLSNVPWLCLSGILVGQMLLKSGLAVRLAYKCILLAGDSFYKVLLGLMLAGFVVAPLILTTLGKMAIFCALGVGICEAMKLEKDSKESAAVMFTCLFAVSTCAYCYLTGCIQIPAAMQLMSNVSGLTVSWFDYAYHNFVQGFIYSVICFLIMLFVLKPKNISDTKKLVENKYNDLGNLTLSEKKATGVIFLTLFFL